jgi:hypothetical protein
MACTPVVFTGCWLRPLNWAWSKWLYPGLRTHVRIKDAWDKQQGRHYSRWWPQGERWSSTPLRHRQAGLRARGASKENGGSWGGDQSRGELCWMISKLAYVFLCGQLICLLRAPFKVRPLFSCRTWEKGRYLLCCLHFRGDFQMLLKGKSWVVQWTEVWRNIYTSEGQRKNSESQVS